MKFYREGHRVIEEVEDIDCPPNMPKEALAEILLRTIQVGFSSQNLQRQVAMGLTEREKRKMEGIETDVKERWEVVP